MGHLPRKSGRFALFGKVFSIEQIYELVFKNGPFTPYSGVFRPLFLFYLVMDKKLYFKDYYQKHKDKILENSHNYYHSGLGKEVIKNYQERNREILREYHKNYSKTYYHQKVKKINCMEKIEKKTILYFN